MPFHKIVPSPSPAIKVRQSRKQIMVYSILPKNERWDNFEYVNFGWHFGGNDDFMNSFWIWLTFSMGIT